MSRRVPTSASRQESPLGGGVCEDPRRPPVGTSFLLCFLLRSPARPSRFVFHRTQGSPRQLGHKVAQVTFELCNLRGDPRCGVSAHAPPGKRVPLELQVPRLQKGLSTRGPASDLESLYVKYAVLCPEKRMWDGGFPAQSLCIPDNPSRSQPEGTPLFSVLNQTEFCPVATGVCPRLPWRMISVGGSGYYCVRFNVKRGEGICDYEWIP